MKLAAWVKRRKKKERRRKEDFFFYTEALCTRFEASTVPSSMLRAMCEVEQ